MVNTQIKKHGVGALICMLLLGLVAFCGTAPVEATDTSSNMTINSNKMIALTFDDGPSEYTNRLLDILSENNAKATFFVTGSKVGANQQVLEKALLQDCEIVGHTWSHSDLTSLSVVEIKQELLKTNNELQDKLGVYPQMFRPPFGEINNNIITAAEELNLAIILWSISTLDWQNQNAAKIHETIVNNVHDGAIILCHDTIEATIDAMDTTIPELISKGYTLVTVSELLGETTPGQIYRNSINNWTGTVHTVQHGESLWLISKNFGVSVDAIKALNGLTSDLIHPGQLL
ncbi:MAG: polysaccharide deacetylase family protein, partial [Candidatus Bathyarchaeota archaeon]|nr:polysaccharide deacetylase family protein [Candidatus Termiticorpusculum sp.]